jgi:hypothetical protein
MVKEKRLILVAPGLVSLGEHVFGQGRSLALYPDELADLIEDQHITRKAFDKASIKVWTEGMHYNQDDPDLILDTNYLFSSALNMESVAKAIMVAFNLHCISPYSVHGVPDKKNMMKCEYKAKENHRFLLKLREKINAHNIRLDRCHIFSDGEQIREVEREDILAMEIMTFLNSHIESVAHEFHGLDLLF